ncbi:alpha/beta fold hydrolase [Arthrobacter sp. B1I2]|uniref:alpha/beta fold hydrolase n=1 Tax=Arthrobacter sp. B1I2 TaxID=3042263 RepID=UPI002781659A|nr:alpha/beta hydrolase [Arthrobacter sp. B1I2]MDQ0733164.1 pimeloyl-ACP methyl ester carboxylesterase [Arthrobacter sp. B1I2]
MATTPQTPHARPGPGKSGPQIPARPGRVARWRIGRVVALSLAVGILAAVLLAAAPFVRARESEITGAVLCGFALGWAMLAILSVRFTDQPQRWAFVPAVFMGTGGLLLVVFGSPVDGVLSWLWPPALLALVIWMFFQVRRHLHGRSRGWLIYPVLAILALASIGGGYQTLGAAADARAFPAPGQLIDVGGYRLHLNCTGSGSPTVVLQPGAGEMSSNHGWIATAIANDTRVCVSDRAGRGWSESADNAQDATQIAADLHTLLHRGNVPGPYVLAGHSFGGLYVLTFAARYPDEVAGMVLMDSTDRAATDTPGAAAAPGSYDALGRISALISTTARLGLGRVYAPLEVGTLPARSRDEVRANIASPANLRSTLDEYIQANRSMQEAASLRDFGSKPLVVLTAGVGNSSRHQDAQNTLAGLSTNSVHQTVDWASHEALVADQAGAAVTTQAILDVVSSVRSGGPLAR